MPAKPTDRRIQRTRAQLQGALVSLMVEKGYEAITVQDIIDRANVGRSTFYAHFADKQTLLSSSVENLRGFLAAHQQRGSREPDGLALGFSLAMLEHTAQNVPLYRAIAGRESGAYVLQKMHDMIADLVRKDLQGLGARPAQRDLAVEFVTGAFMAVLTWWLDHGARQTPAEVDDIFRALVTNGLTAALGLRQGA